MMKSYDSDTIDLHFPILGLDLAKLINIWIIWHLILLDFILLLLISEKVLCGMQGA